VRFDWQTNNTTHFIRVMSPDAGGTDQVTQNRGYVAIPEVGDQVMVNFVHNHPDRPFVMGGMFHGGIGLGGGINNHMRSIQTKSGIKVLMNDDEGSVNIIDPSGNTYFMDGKGNITVTAPKKMTFNVGENLDIKVGQNMNTSVGADQSNIVGMNKTESITMNSSQSVGAVKNVMIGGNFMTNVVGKMMEFIKGNKESEVEMDSQKVVKGERLIHSEKDHKIHSQTEINGQANEKTNMH
jgi:type VI secretion system secreted protein VgrG